MINYLNQKYDAEFVYYDYEPPELLNSEKLYAYPKSTGIGNGKYLVTVKARNGGFEDDFHDFSVAKLAEDNISFPIRLLGVSLVMTFQLIRREPLLLLVQEKFHVM